MKNTKRMEGQETLPQTHIILSSAPLIPAPLRGARVFVGRVPGALPPANVRQPSGLIELPPSRSDGGN
jgi:hypothetical protein